MSSRNDESQGDYAAIGFIAAGLVFIGLVIFAIAAFLALIGTIVAILAWNKTLHLGSHTITPDEARCFIYGGIIGAAVLPLFVLFTTLLFGLHTHPDVWKYAMVGGYTLGSIGLVYMTEQASQSAPTTPPSFAWPPTTIGSPPVASLPPPPYQFASWDDEERQS